MGGYYSDRDGRCRYFVDLLTHWGDFLKVKTHFNNYNYNESLLHICMDRLQGGLV